MSNEHLMQQIDSALKRRHFYAYDLTISNDGVVVICQEFEPEDMALALNDEIPGCTYYPAGPWSRADRFEVVP